jgi:hypothetical protein
MGEQQAEAGRGVSDVGVFQDGDHAFDEREELEEIEGDAADSTEGQGIEGGGEVAGNSGEDSNLLGPGRGINHFAAK